MNPHEEIQGQIPAYAAARLDPEAARRLEEHLAGCDSCRELAATAREIAGAIREGGEALFEPHPRELALREYAAGTSTSGENARIERHLSFCPSCRLEVESWKSAIREPKPAGGIPGKVQGGRVRAGGLRWWVPSLSAAAGLLVGAALILLVQRFPEPPPATKPPALPPPALSERWEGDSPLYFLPPMTRGGEEMPIPTWILGKGDSHLSLGVQPVLPPEIADEVICRLELVRDDGGRVWSAEMSAGKMREHLKTPAEVVHLTLPTADLRPGRYEFRIAPASGPPAPPIYSARIEIAAAR